jgi:class 3 adenylate cyclase
MICPLGVCASLGPAPRSRLFGVLVRAIVTSAGAASSPATTAPTSGKTGLVASDPDTRYARTADGLHIAFQVSGEGPLDIVEIGDGTLFPIDATSEQARWQAYVDRLTSFSRLIRFDLRGIGLSDPLGASSPFTLEQWAADTLAVLDATGSERAVLMGTAQSTTAAILLAATHPERVRALVLINAFARIVRTPDYPAGVPAAVFESFFEGLVDPEAPQTDDVPLMAPSLAHDDSFRAWWRRAGHRGASPAMATAVWRMLRDCDVRALLGDLAVPALVVHARDNAFIRVGHGRYLAEHIPGARYIELATADHVPWAGAADIAGEVEEFLTGTRHVPASHRPLAAVLFTDIVGSTEHAALLGDRAWKERLDQHDEMTERQIRRFAGRLVKSTGDGTLTTFDAPARAIQCALAIRDALHQLGLDVRAGVHIGEIELRGDDVAGIAVHIAQRVCSLAGPGDVLVSRTVVDLVTGSDFAFEDRGEHDLKGIPGGWRLFAVTD